MIRPATAKDMADWYGTAIDLRCMERNGEVFAIGGLYRRPDGRSFAVLDVKDGARGINIALWVRRWFRTLPRPIYAACWEAHYQTAPRLLTVLGFRPTDEVQSDRKRIWVLP